MSLPLVLPVVGHFYAASRLQAGCSFGISPLVSFFCRYFSSTVGESLGQPQHCRALNYTELSLILANKRRPSPDDDAKLGTRHGMFPNSRLWPRRTGEVNAGGEAASPWLPGIFKGAGLVSPQDPKRPLEWAGELESWLDRHAAAAASNIAGRTSGTLEDDRRCQVTC